jgi:hypothetical protein
VLALIRAWLRAGIMDQDRLWHNHVGVPQGGPISPVLANVYLHGLDRTWVERGYERPGGLDAKLIRYADDSALRTLREVAMSRVVIVWRRCCAGDGGGPSGTALQGEVSNHRKLLRCMSRGGERCGKGVREASGGSREGERE